MPAARSDYADEVDALRRPPLSANVRAFGVGSGAVLETLQIIDNSAMVFTNTDELLEAFGGLSGGQDVVPEPGLAGWRIYADLDGDEQFDDGTEPSAVTDAQGEYAITGLAPGRYTFREVMQPDWRQTAPAAGYHTFDVTAGLTIDYAHFGNVEARPTAVFGNSGPVDEGGTATVSFTGQVGAGPLKYSYDLDGNGTFEITGSDDPTAPLPPALTADGSVTRTVRGRITDVRSQSITYTTSVEVRAVAPTLAITGDGTAALGEPYTLALSSTDPGKTRSRPGRSIGATARPPRSPAIRPVPSTHM